MESEGSTRHDGGPCAGIELAMLIHTKSGLLLNHVAEPGASGRDPDLVSGMLMAIQDFVRSKLERPDSDGSLEAIRVGGLEVCVEAGPRALLAVVARGGITADCRVALRETIQQIHLDFCAELRDFSGDTAPFTQTGAQLARLVRRNRPRYGGIW